MPAYFSLVVECSKNCSENDLILDFYTLLTENGLTYLGGCSDNTANCSLNEIAAKNHGYLLNDKNSKNAEKYMFDFLQAEFQYSAFHETHVSLLDDPDDDFFTFDLIIPEDDLVIENIKKVYWDREKINKLLDLAKQIWGKKYVNSIQTELEISEGFCSVDEITKGSKPSVEPFAILPEKAISNRIHEFPVFGQADRGGVILLNWNAANFEWNILPENWKKRIMNSDRFFY